MRNQVSTADCECFGPKNPLGLPLEPPNSRYPSHLAHFSFPLSAGERPPRKPFGTLVTFLQ